MTTLTSYAHSYWKTGIYLQKFNPTDLECLRLWSVSNREEAGALCRQLELAIATEIARRYWNEANKDEPPKEADELCFDFSTWSDADVGNGLALVTYVTYVTEFPEFGEFFDVLCHYVAGVAALRLRATGDERNGTGYIERTEP